MVSGYRFNTINIICICIDPYDLLHLFTLELFLTRVVPVYEEFILIEAEDQDVAQYKEAILDEENRW